MFQNTHQQITKIMQMLLLKMWKKVTGVRGVHANV